MNGEVEDRHNTQRLVVLELARQVNLRVGKLRILLMVLADMLPQPSSSPPVTSGSTLMAFDIFWEALQMLDALEVWGLDDTGGFLDYDWVQSVVGTLGAFSIDVMSFLEKAAGVCDTSEDDQTEDRTFPSDRNATYGIDRGAPEAVAPTRPVSSEDTMTDDTHAHFSSASSTRPEVVTALNLMEARTTPTTAPPVSVVLGSGDHTKSLGSGARPVGPATGTEARRGSGSGTLATTPTSHTRVPTRAATRSGPCPSSGPREVAGLAPGSLHAGHHTRGRDEGTGSVHATMPGSGLATARESGSHKPTMPKKRPRKATTSTTTTTSGGSLSRRRTMAGRGLERFFFK